MSSRRRAGPPPPPSLVPFLEGTPGLDSGSAGGGPGGRGLGSRPTVAKFAGAAALEAAQAAAALPGSSALGSMPVPGGAGGLGSALALPPASASASAAAARSDPGRGGGGGSRAADPSLLSATGLTHLAGCRCPHLDAVLPHVLKLDRYDPVVDMHLGGHFGDIAPVSSTSARARAPSASVAFGADGLPLEGAGRLLPSPPFSHSRSGAFSKINFGHEHNRLLSVAGRGGAAGAWCPVLPPLQQPSGVIAGSGSGGGGSSGSGSKRRKSADGPGADSAGGRAGGRADRPRKKPLTTTGADRPRKKPLTTAGADRPRKKPLTTYNAVIAEAMALAKNSSRAVAAAAASATSDATKLSGAADEEGPGAATDGKPAGTAASATSAVTSEAARAAVTSEKSDKDEKMADAKAVEDEEMADAKTEKDADIADAKTEKDEEMTAAIYETEKGSPDTAESSHEKETIQVAAKSNGDFDAAGDTSADATADKREANRTDENEGNPTNEKEADSTDEKEVDPTDEKKATPTDEKKNDSTDEKAPDSTEKKKATPTDETKTDGIDEKEANSKGEAEADLTEKEEADSADEKETDPTEKKEADSNKSAKADRSERSEARSSEQEKKGGRDVLGESGAQLPLATGEKEVESGDSVKEFNKVDVDDGSKREGEAIIATGDLDESLVIADESGTAAMDVESKQVEEVKSGSGLEDSGSSLKLDVASISLPEGLKKVGQNKVPDKAKDKVPESGTREAEPVSSESAVALPLDVKGDLTLPKDLTSPKPLNVLSDLRYAYLRSRDRRIQRERDSILTSDQLFRRSNSKRKKAENSNQRMPIIVTDDELSSEKRLMRSRLRLDASVAASKVEEWLEVIRTTRGTYWDSKKKGRSRLSCQWCPLSENAYWGRRGASGDDLMRCLECSAIGSGPSSTNPDSSLCMMKHFIASGHNFGMTCGPRSELFCFKCGDFVYHEVVDREKERVDIARIIPRLSLEPGPLQRSYEPLSFVTTSDHGVVWRGMTASYPSVAPAELTLAARLSLRRFKIFHGEIGAGCDQNTLGPLALRFASDEKRSGEHCPRIEAPVGLYNLGNTCFMSSVLQCLINCAPLQRYFLSEVKHDHKSCELLQSAPKAPPLSTKKSGRTSRNKICIACEMDRLFLQYYGSAIGEDVLAVLDETPSPSVHRIPKSCADASITPKTCGQPLVIPRLLACTWRSAGMKHLAGYDQRDAHEFLQAFLNTMKKHDHRYISVVQEMREYSNSFSFNKEKSVVRPVDIVNHLFEGTLRSVLICGKCGYKRSQPEPFLNISLPLGKDLDNVESCLKHFIQPEELSDVVLCPSCEAKTPTKKQHTFAKLPKILCLHLKRFDAATNKKISDPVSFPAKGLDLGPCLPHWSEVVQGMATAEGISETHKTNGTNPHIYYDLFATVNHDGTLNQGHYVANVEVDGKWFHCNDAYVCDAGEGDGKKAVLAENSSAYLLFYSRRQ